MKQQSKENNSNNNNRQALSDAIEMKEQFNNNNNNNKNQNQQPNNLLCNNYARKRSILRKLMICQRKKFMFKKEQLEMDRMKKNLADTSISNFSQAEGFVNNAGAGSKLENNNNGVIDEDNPDQAENIK
jgi:hypothetical protein